MVTANAVAVAVPHTALSQENFIILYQIFIILNRSFDTQFKEFHFLVAFEFLIHFPSFSSCSSSNCRGIRHSAFQDRLMLMASPNFLLKRCFFSSPNFVSTEFDASGSKFANFIRYASSAA